MKNAVILHGMPPREEYYDPESASQSNKHWIPWVQRQLILNDILAQAPELPEPYRPAYEKWKNVFAKFKIDKDTILIGHSCGSSFLLRWLSENDIKTSKVVLVAPWLDPNEELDTGFFDFNLDPSLVKKTQGITVFVSSDDSQEVLDSVERIKKEIKDVKVITFNNRGHFTSSDMNKKEFPEILKEVLSQP